MTLSVEEGRNCRKLGFNYMLIKKTIFFLIIFVFFSTYIINKNRSITITSLGNYD